MQRSILTFLALRRIRKLGLQYPCVGAENVTPIAVKAKELRMQDFFKKHKQTLIVCTIAALVLCYPAMWHAYMIDFIVFSWFINELVNLSKKLLNKGESHD